MTFDEQLKRAADTLASRLRDEIEHQVHTAADDIGALARADRDQAAADARDAAERIAAERITAAVADAEARAYAYGKEEGSEQFRGMEIDASERLVDALRAIDGARSLTGIIDLLVARAAREGDRAAVLLVRGDRLRGWRFIGFDAAVDAGEAVELTAEDAGMAWDAVKTNAVVEADRAQPIRAPAFAASESARDSVCVPIAIAADVVAVLYADRAEASASHIWRHRIEVLSRHAARCLEALIAFKAARMLADAPGDAAILAERSDAAAAEDETAARRYARLLVSEIRLYHEDAVAAGRRERDLATRLGGEIARARMLYEQRVASRVRQRADYFQDELVRTLANGDPDLLELRP
jgi:hypothetical protein